MTAPPRRHAPWTRRALLAACALALAGCAAEAPRPATDPLHAEGERRRAAALADHRALVAQQDRVRRAHAAWVADRAAGGARRPALLAEHQEVLDAYASVVARHRDRLARLDGLHRRIAAGGDAARLRAELDVADRQARSVALEGQRLDTRHAALARALATAGR